ncbi:MAG TPA: amidohydrolase family protein [Gemmatimonadota bacterium]|nr:amidohydrolase family protein [Gemmatimonadota bacterium]
MSASFQHPLPRRRFLQIGGLATAGAALGRWPDLPLSIRPPLDLLLRGGTVVDGTGAAPFRADIGVRHGRIVAVGLLPDAQATLALDVAGHAVAPGFIDIHGHTDLGILVDNRADSKVRQGVTTEVVGQDGSSILPVSDRMRAERRADFEERYGVAIEFAGWDEWFGLIAERGHLTNWVTLVGSGTVREAVLGADDREPTAEELARMIALVEAALEAGAAGVSSGLEYTPNAYATAREIALLARPAADRDLPYATHMRNEADRVEEALAEALAVAGAAAAPLLVSHLKAQGPRNWHKAERLLAAIEGAHSDAAHAGRTVHFDRYPYTAYSTGLASLFPAWAKDGGTEAFLARLADPTEESRLRVAVDEKIAMMGSWDAIQIASVAGDAPEDAAGRRLGEYAAEKETDPYALTVRLLGESSDRVSIVGHGMSEDNTKMFVSHPLGAICSDASARRSEGPLSEGTPHPRAYGAFPRVLGRYVREERALSLAEAVRKMTGLPAEILRLQDRGQVAVGKAADLVVFDPGTVADRATYEAPHQYPAGIPHVVVNGALAVRDGQPTGALSGRVPRPG